MYEWLLLCVCAQLLEFCVQRKIDGVVSFFHSLLVSSLSVHVIFIIDQHRPFQPNELPTSGRTHKHTHIDPMRANTMGQTETEPTIRK